MKTPDEIKRGLDECTRLGGCAACPYFDIGIAARCTPVLAADALAYIQQLEAKLAAEIEVVLSKLETTTRERDAAIEDMRGRCYACVHAKPHQKYSGYNECKYISVAIGGTGRTLCDHWEWRGVPQEAEHE